MRIDAHNHFWQYDPITHSWIDDSMEVIREDFLPDDIYKELIASNIDGIVAVQADQTEEETQFLLKLAQDHDFVKGVVGWLDLQDDELEQRLELYSTQPKLKGLRHIVQAEPDPSFILEPSFQRGIGRLQKFGLTYDLLVFTHQLKAAIQTVRNFPNQPFVLDHLAKPPIREGEIDLWKSDIQALAQSENVMCKLSGMVTEADWTGWKTDDFTPYLEVVVEAFGTDRIMFGSDWPVYKVAAEYHEVTGIVESHFASFSSLEKEKIFGGNAIRFYGLEE